MAYIPYENTTNFSIIQTFFVDPNAVDQSTEVSITSVDLYFKKVPDTSLNSSGLTSPGVVVSLCEVENGVPVLAKTLFGSSARLDTSAITAYQDASTAITFSLPAPLKIKTNRDYGVIIYFEDNGFELWTNIEGNKLVGTNTPSSGTNSFVGKVFLRNNSGTFTAQADRDLKFKVKVAKYVANTYSEIYTNQNFELLTFTFDSGTFLTGEYVYKPTTNATGNVALSSGNAAIVGTGTTFTSLEPGTKIAVWGNTSHKQVLTVNSVVNATYITTTSAVPYTNTSTKFMVPVVGKLYYQDRIKNVLYLTDSNANSSLKLAANDVLYGSDSGANGTVVSVDTFSVDHFALNADIAVPSSGLINVNVSMAYWNGSAYPMTTRNILPIIGGNTVYVSTEDTRILSRSLEVDQATLYTNANLEITSKSFVINSTYNVAQSNTNLFMSPTVKNGVIDVYTSKFNISNTYTSTDANSVVIDTEVAGNGIALSRYISTKLRFANNKFAEDLRTYMVAYRPSNTDIKVYARLHNSADPEAFDDKAWTPLTYVENGNRYSSATDRDDLIEYTLGLPSYSESANVLPGSFTTELSNSVIVATGVTPTTYLANNDMVKVYNPLIPEDYIIAVAETVNSTAVVLGDAISNNNLIGSGFKVDRLKYYNIAFNNITNDNVARYYSESLVEYDKFDSVQIKIVMLSDTTYRVPRIDSITPIGVSA